MFNGVDPGPVIGDGDDGGLLAAFSERVVHLRLEIITELLIGNVSGRDRGEYCVLALNLAHPVEEGTVVLLAPEDLCS